MTEIQTRGGDPREPRRDSTCDIPEFGKLVVSPGTLTVQRVDTVDGKQIVTGRFNFTMETEGKGQKRGIGNFRAVLKVVKTR